MIARLPICCTLQRRSRNSTRPRRVSTPCFQTMPMGIGNPEDVAHAMVFLASPFAKFITGAGLDIGGTIRGLV
jgi:NAD(P)-dependent dehydrogenase (short-subunit alcohol dehydrogenase family)